MRNKKPLTNNQQKLYKALLKLIRQYRATFRTLRHSPFRYCIDQIRFLAFNRKNTTHESCCIITEKTTAHIILKSITFEDFAAALEAIEIDYHNILEEQGVRDLFTIYYKLVEHISNQMLETGEAIGTLSDILSILRLRPQFSRTFDPSNIGCYERFVSRLIRQENFNLERLAEEARIVLSTDTVLCMETILMRGLAHTIRRMYNPESFVDHGVQIEVEARTGIRLSVTAASYEYRERIVSQANAAYATAHPYRYRILAIALYFSARLGFLAPAYVVGVLSTFDTRVFSEFAFNRLILDVEGALNNSLCNSNITLHLNRNVTYNNTLNHLNYNNTLNYLNHTNTSNTLNCNNTLNFNNTNINITVFAPQHSSEYFPEYAGLFNGFPSYITTLLAFIQLACALPPTIITAHKRCFMLNYLENYVPTPEEARENLQFSGIVLFRWFSNVALQPADCILHPYKDAFFKWSIFRFFSPCTAIEEPMKFSRVHNTLNRFSYRNEANFNPYSRVSFLTAAIILFCEYFDTAYLKHQKIAFSLFTKFLRTVSVLRPLVQNRMHGNMLYHPDFENLVFLNLSRILLATPLLPLYDTVGDRLIYMNLLTGIDVLATANVDTLSSRIFTDVSMMEEHLAAIEDIIQNAVENRGAMALFAPELQRRFTHARTTIPLSMILAEDHYDAQQQRENQEEEEEVYVHKHAPKKLLAKEMLLDDSEEGVKLVSVKYHKSHQPTSQDADQACKHLHQHILLHQGHQDFKSTPEKRKTRKPIHKKQKDSIYTQEDVSQTQQKSKQKKSQKPEGKNVTLLSHTQSTDHFQNENETFTMPTPPQPQVPAPTPRLRRFLEFAQADLDALEQQHQLSTDAYRRTHRTRTTQHVTTATDYYDNILQHRSRIEYLECTRGQQHRQQPYMHHSTQVATHDSNNITLTSRRQRGSTESVSFTSPIFIQQSTGSTGGATEDDVDPSTSITHTVASAFDQSHMQQPKQ